MTPLGCWLGVSERVGLLARWLGGAEEDRTPDLLCARQVLSQLSYGPKAAHGTLALPQGSGATGEVVGLGGFEPPTSPLSGVRSNHAELQTLRARTGRRSQKQRK